MTALETLEKAVLDALAADSELIASANFIGRRTERERTAPYALIEPLDAGDWATKDRIGLEARLSLMLASNADEPDEMHALTGAAERVLLGFAGTYSDWQIVSVRIVRRRTLARRGGARGSGPQWRGILDARVRMIAVD